jgi:hypothetical protein
MIKESRIDVRVGMSLLGGATGALTGGITGADIAVTGRGSKKR